MRECRKCRKHKKRAREGDINELRNKFGILVGFELYNENNLIFNLNFLRF